MLGLVSILSWLMLLVRPIYFAILYVSKFNKDIRLKMKHQSFYKISALDEGYKFLRSRCSDDDNFVILEIDTFVEDYQTFKSRLEENINCPSALLALLHNLGSDCAGVGAFEFSEVIRNIEKLLEDGVTILVRQKIEEANICDNIETIFAFLHQKKIELLESSNPA